MSYFTVPPCAPGAFQHRRRAGSCLEGSPGATAGPRAGLGLQALGWCCRAPPCPCQGLRMPAWDSGCPSGRRQGAPWGRAAPAAVTPSSAPAGAASARSASQGEALAVQPMRGARGSSMSICVCGGVSPQQGGPCNHPPGLQTLSLKAMLVAEAFDFPPAFRVPTVCPCPSPGFVSPPEDAPVPAHPSGTLCPGEEQGVSTQPPRVATPWDARTWAAGAQRAEAPGDTPAVPPAGPHQGTGG